jgi:hypothetical protein
VDDVLVVRSVLVVDDDDSKLDDNPFTLENFGLVVDGSDLVVEDARVTIEGGGLQYRSSSQNSNRYFCTPGIASHIQPRKADFNMASASDTENSYVVAILGPTCYG